METIYILEKCIRDKLGRSKKTIHIGAFNSLDKLEDAKRIHTNDQHPITFEVYISENWFPKLNDSQGITI